MIDSKFSIVNRTIQFQSGATYLALVCFPNSTVVVMTTLIPTEFLIMIFQFESLVLHNAGFHQPYVDFHFYWVSNSVQFKIVSRFDLLFNTNDSIAFAYNQLVDRPEFKDLSFCKIIWQVFKYHFWFDLRFSIFLKSSVAVNYHVYWLG